jgi:hypothetical protein
MNETTTASSKSPKELLLDGIRYRMRLASIGGGCGIFLLASAVLSSRGVPSGVVLVLSLLALAVLPVAFQSFGAKQLELLRFVLDDPGRIAWVFRGPFPRSCREVSPWPWRLFWEKIPVGGYLFEIRTSDGTTLRSTVTLDQAEDVAAWLREIAPSAFPPSAAPVTPSPAADEHHAVSAEGAEKGTP